MYEINWLWDKKEELENWVEIFFKFLRLFTNTNANRFVEFKIMFSEKSLFTVKLFCNFPPELIFWKLQIDKKNYKGISR